MKTKNMLEELMGRRNRLVSIIRDVEKRLQKAPSGSVRVIKHKYGYQFYQRNESSEKNGTYIPVTERQKAISLVQKKYDQQIKTAAEKQLKVINKFLKDYSPDVLKNIYKLLPEGRKELTNPVELPDAEYVRKWLSYEYDKKPFREGTPEHYTSAGERVRSKSEVMIADTLKQNGIPYRYECPLNLGNVIVHPDFTILRVEDRETLYWEHLGLMDDSTYCQNALKKMRLYEENDIFPGINLILTMETSGIPINLAVIRNMIEKYCV